MGCFHAPSHLLQMPLMLGGQFLSNRAGVVDKQVFKGGKDQSFPIFFLAGKNMLSPSLSLHWSRRKKIKLKNNLTKKLHKKIEKEGGKQELYH